MTPILALQPWFEYHKGYFPKSDARNFVISILVVSFLLLVLETYF
jgi:hypothetical protein